MKTRILTYALAAAGLVCGTFQAAAQPGGGGGRGPILSQEDRTAVQEATREQLTKLRADLQASQNAARQKVVADSQQAINTFIGAVRKSCVCRKEMLFNP